MSDLVKINGVRSGTMHKQAQGLLKRAKANVTLPEDHPLRDVYNTSLGHHVNCIFGCVKNTAHDHKVHITSVIIPPEVRRIVKELKTLNMGPEFIFTEDGCLENWEIVPNLKKYMDQNAIYTAHGDREKRIKHQLRLFGAIYDADDLEYYETTLKHKMAKQAKQSAADKAKHLANAEAKKERQRLDAENKAKAQERKKNKPVKANAPIKTLRKTSDSRLTTSQLRKKYNGQWMRARYTAFELLGTDCMCCGIEAGMLNEMGCKAIATGDHVLPFNHNPLLRTELLNIQILCNNCNEPKADIYHTDWRKPEHIRKLMTHRLGFAPDNERDMMVLLEYVGYKHTQREAAKNLKIGQATVSRTYNKYKELLREEDLR